MNWFPTRKRIQMGGTGKIHKCSYAGCESVFNRPYRLAQHLLVHKNVSGDDSAYKVGSAHHLPKHLCDIVLKNLLARNGLLVPKVFIRLKLSFSRKDQNKYERKLMIFDMGTNLHKQFCCTEESCGKSFTNNTHLKRHINTVHNKSNSDVIYSCPKCMKVFSNRQNLKRHLNVHEKPLCCDICKKTFIKKNLLQAHIYTHTGVKPFSCELCSKEFVSNYDKNKHMRRHKTYKCEICNHKFLHWSKYLKHKKTVHDTPDFICDDCGRKFKKRSHIVRHVKTHDSCVKLYECPYKGCERSYTSKSNLNQHYAVKHDDFGYICNICETKLTSKAKLKAHLEKIHNGIKSMVQIPKTLSTGRKPRKDIGVYKISTALKISGLVTDGSCEEQRIENCSALVTEDNT